VDLYSALLRHTCKALRYDTGSQEILQFYLHTPRSSTNRMNHTCLCSHSRSWYSFTDLRGMKGWVGLGIKRCFIGTAITLTAARTHTHIHAETGN